ncbi:MAG: hypothetical protein ACK41C_12790 [Phenylobacterium sp.]|uniref:phage adaptor protein n=1 Tax=Phenylobacterium sp. TaxID=1871053 RepID=UPI00391D0938
MALSNYAQLQAAVADWLERADLAVRIPDFIRLAEAQMNRSLRLNRMIRRAEAEIDAARFGLPADFLEAITLKLSDGEASWTLQPAPPEVVERRSAQNARGRPRYWSLAGNEIRCEPAPERPFAAELTYYARIPSLSDAGPSNWILAEHPDAYLFGALKEAAPFLRDAEATAAFEAKHQAALAALRAAERTAAGPLRTEDGLRSISAL